MQLKAKCSFYAHLGRIPENYQTQQWKNEEKMDPQLGVNILDEKVTQKLMDSGCGPVQSFQACSAWWNRKENHKGESQMVFFQVFTGNVQVN